MPQISGDHDGRRVLTTVAVFRPTFTKAMSSAVRDDDDPVFQMHVFNGLFDTGATTTCISASVV
jgi:hypothetical protein